MLLIWSLTKPTHNSTKACVFDGTPEVARRVTSQIRPRPTKPSSTDITRVSTLIVMNPAPPPTGLVRKVR